MIGKAERFRQERQDKGRVRMNILFLLTPKASCSVLYNDFTIRQALERMECDGYTSMSILDRQGKYIGALTEGDLLWACKNICGMDLKQTETHSIMEIPHRRDNRPVPVTTDIRKVVETAADQNFIPVVDDKGDFIGIITRSKILEYIRDNFITKEE